MHINDADRKVLEAIQSNLHQYEKHGIELSHLVSRLEELFRLLTSTETQWNNVFFENWVNLESVYAGSLEPERLLNVEEEKIVKNSVQVMSSITKKLLDDFTKYPNNTITKSVESLDDNWLVCPECLDAWESKSNDPLVICPKCDNTFINPRFKDIV